MQIDARMHQAARAQTRAVAVRRPPGCAHGARSRACPPRRRRSAHALVGGAHAVVALLLLLLLPLGLVHRSSTGACRYDHRVAVAAGVGAVHDVAVDAPVAASPGHERVAAGNEHDHGASGLPLDGPAPSACGPAIRVERSAAPSEARYRSVLPEWRALSPLALAPPPPAPPPRLS